MAAWVRVAGIQLGEDVFHAARHRFFGDGQQTGDLLVCISGSNQPKDLHFGRGQGIVCRVFGKFEGGLQGTGSSCRNEPPESSPVGSYAKYF